MRALLALLVLLLAGPGEARVAFHALASQTPPELLSETGLFADMAARRLADGAIAYRPSAQLFSDHADKVRAIVLPPGTTAGLAGDGLLALPVGTVLLKSFGALGRTFETRLLVHRADGWVALPYVWDADGREARLRRAGARLLVDVPIPGAGPREIAWQVPNVNQCKTCHSAGRALVPIGVKARNLAATGDLARLAALGLLLGAERMAQVARVPDPADARAPIEARARAWLDANCAHCHARDGSASNSGLFLTWEEADSVALGIGKRPVAAGRGSGGRHFAIAPGAPDASIFLYRMESSEPGVMMPELGRTLPDPEGIALMRAWIASLRP